jgi:hypothetical protein
LPSSKQDASLVGVLNHPLRVRILELLNEKDMAPVDFVKEGHADFYFGFRPSVSHVAYHFRELVDAGCLTDVAWRKSGASVATIWRGTARIEAGDEGWAGLDVHQKRQRCRASAQGLIVRMEGALSTDNFSAEGDSHPLAWIAMRLDERGLTEAREALAGALTRIREVQEESRARLAESDEEGATVTVGTICFGSPSSS